MYNVKKYNILAAIKECNDADIPAVGPLLSTLTGIDYEWIRTKLSRLYFQDYLTRKAYYENKRYKCQQYKLSKKGISVLEKFSIRMLNGHDLNIRRKEPRPFDWSQVELLPGLHILEEIKKEKKRK